MDEEDLEEYAELWGVSSDEVEALFDALGVEEPETEVFAEPDDHSEPTFEPEDDDLEEYAELWDVEPEDVEALFDVVDLEDFGGMTQEELASYIDDLYDELIDEGFDLDVSDLWDMYYGYGPGGET